MSILTSLLSLPFERVYSLSAPNMWKVLACGRRAKFSLIALTSSLKSVMSGFSTVPRAPMSLVINESIHCNKLSRDDEFLAADNPDSLSHDSTLLLQYVLVHRSERVKKREKTDAFLAKGVLSREGAEREVERGGGRGMRSQFDEPAGPKWSRKWPFQRRQNEFAHKVVTLPSNALKEASLLLRGHWGRDSSHFIELTDDARVCVYVLVGRTS